MFKAWLRCWQALAGCSQRSCSSLVLRSVILTHQSRMPSAACLLSAPPYHEFMRLASTASAGQPYRCVACADACADARARPLTDELGHSAALLLAAAVLPGYRARALTPAQRLEAGRLMQRLCGAEGSTASVQLDMFVDEPNKLGMLVSDFAAQLTTVTWWRRHGHLCPALQKQAMNILSIPATSSGCSVRSSDRRQRLQQGRMPTSTSTRAHSSGPRQPCHGRSLKSGCAACQCQRMRM